jgi:hypothetical protein
MGRIHPLDHDLENLCAAGYLPRASRAERLDGKEQDIL